MSGEDIKKIAIDKGLKVAILVCVSPDNNNKYFNMYEQGNGTYMVIRGRVDVTEIIEGPYPMSKWDVHYKDKTKENKKPKPYTDHTALFSEKKTTSSDPKAKKKDSGNFHSKRVASIIDFVTALQRYANKSVEENYTVSAANVTKKQVDLAQSTLNEISGMIKKGAEMGTLNNKLMEFFQIIPRRMSNVWDHLFVTDDMRKHVSKIDELHKVKDKEKIAELKIKMNESKIKTEEEITEFKDKVGKEQDTLDVMAGQVAVEEQERKDEVTPATATKKEYDLLHAMGLDMEEVTSDEVDMIKNMLDKNAHHNGEKNSRLFKRAFKVINNKTHKSYNDWMGKTKNQKKEYLWHGSRNENWWSIFQQGLILRPTNAIITGKMFGYGIYFADKAQKSINYSSYSGAGRSYTGGTSNRAILAVFEVHQGSQYEILKHKNEHTQLTKDKMDKLGFDSVYAKGGADLVNNEYIVYDDSQCTIKYLVEIGN